ncbi:MAG: hypothetical protein JSU86_05825 [Phycisphaerales bacterium]|nr:MAG: hypothetical protein JSU86_05825 [Phycisphaerales bacterium]
MRNYMMTLGITVLLFAPVSTWADGPSADASHQAYALNDARSLTAGGLLSLASFQDEPLTKEEAESAVEGEGTLIDKSDQSGTNPVNFTFDLRIYNEYQWLNVDGDGEQNTTTLEFRVPFADGKWQFRVRARGNYVNADLPDAGRSPGMFSRRHLDRRRGFLPSLDSDPGIDDCGFGDVDFRFLTVPYFSVEKRFAFAAGLEVFLDTAHEDTLGSGSTSLGPQIFLGFFRPFGLPIDGFFPGYQHKFDVDGNDVHQSVIDLYVLKTWKNKTLWMLLDPQIILDYENNTEFCLFDAEFGTMLDDLLGTKGHSFYVRPSAGIGTDRPFDASIEIGYKIVW